MVNDEILYLINADLDGEIEARERVRLADYLAAEPAARKLREDLRALNALLDSLPAVEPPAGLCDEILNKLPTGEFADPEKPRAPRVARIYRLWPESLKPVLSLAAAIIVAVALVKLAPGSFSPDQVDLAVGSMVNTSAPVESLVVDQPGLSASVSLKPGEASLVLIVKLDSTINTSTLIEVPLNRYELTLRAGDEQAPPGVELVGNTLTINSVGKFEATALLRRSERQAGAGDEAIRVRFVQGDQVVRRATLEIPEKNRD